ncbi:MAG: hypothetical protein ACOVT5_17545 [Armatimonadaceae bacterium]
MVVLPSTSDLLLYLRQGVLVFRFGLEVKFHVLALGFEPEGFRDGDVEGFAASVSGLGSEVGMADNAWLFG